MKRKRTPRSFFFMTTSKCFGYLKLLMVRNSIINPDLKKSSWFQPLSFKIMVDERKHNFYVTAEVKETAHQSVSTFFYRIEIRRIFFSTNFIMRRSYIILIAFMNFFEENKNNTKSAIEFDVVNGR